MPRKIEVGVCRRVVDLNRAGGGKRIGEPANYQ